MEQWFGKTVVVTGAANGIGKRLAEDLAACGLKVIGLDYQDMENINVNAGIIPVKCDVRDLQQVKQAFKFVETNHNGVDILINNAGVGSLGLFTDASADDMKWVIDVNFTGVVFCTKEAMISMKKKDSPCLIIMMNSISGHSCPEFSKPLLNVYSGTKCAMTSLTEHLRREVRFLGLKIKVTSLSPSVVDTPTARQQIKQFWENNLKVEDVSEAVKYIMGTPPHVHIKELIMHAFNDPV